MHCPVRPHWTQKGRALLCGSRSAQACGSRDGARSPWSHGLRMRDERRHADVRCRCELRYGFAAIALVVARRSRPARGRAQPAGVPDAPRALLVAVIRRRSALACTGCSRVAAAAAGSPPAPGRARTFVIAIDGLGNRVERCLARPQPRVGGSTCVGRCASTRHDLHARPSSRHTPALSIRGVLKSSHGNARTDYRNARRGAAG
jgi:hypothetical protein